MKTTTILLPTCSISPVVAITKKIIKIRTCLCAYKAYCRKSSKLVLYLVMNAVKSEVHP